MITYRTTAVLFDEYASDQKYKNRVVYVVAHELAHQWFGNLVTMGTFSSIRPSFDTSLTCYRLVVRTEMQNRYTAREIA